MHLGRRLTSAVIVLMALAFAYPAAGQDADLFPLVPVGTPVWRASGGGEGLTLHGYVAYLDSPFQLNGEFPGATTTFAFTPTGPGGGDVTYTFAGTGVTGHGSGSYVLTAQAADGSFGMVITVTGCVDGIPGSCRTNTANVTFAPVQ